MTNKHTPIFVLALFTVALFMSAPALSQKSFQTAVTWHPGDLLVTMSACSTPEARLHLFGDANAAERQAYSVARICRVSPIPIAISLIKRLKSLMLANGKGASLWKVQDRNGVEIYVILSDDSGPHQPKQIKL